MAIMSAEGGVFDLISGRYAKDGKPLLDIYLKSHAGDAVRIDRINREPNVFDNPVLTVVLTVQPEILFGLAQRDSYQGRGFLARFIYSVPISHIGYRKDISEVIPIPYQVESTYYTNVKNLLQLSSNDQENTTPLIFLSAEAQQEHTLFRKEIEKRLGKNFDLEHMRDWGSKLAGAVGRIAANIHFAQHANEPAPWEIALSGETMRRAIAIGRYLIEHAKAAYEQMGSDPKTEDAKLIIEKIKQTRTLETTERELFQLFKGGRFKKMEVLRHALLLLEQHGYIQIKETPKSGPGRKPSPKVFIHPALFSSDTVLDAGNSENSEEFEKLLPSNELAEPSKSNQRLLTEILENLEDYDEADAL